MSKRRKSQGFYTVREVLAEAEETMNTFTAKVLSSLKKEDVIRLTALMNQLYEASEAEIEKRKKKGDVTE